MIGHYTGLEPFEWPYGSGLQSMVISMAMDVLLNAALLVGSLLVSPVFMAVGSLLTIPVGVVVELLVGATLMSFVQGCGVALILLGSLSFEVGETLFRCALYCASARHQPLASVQAE